MRLPIGLCLLALVFAGPLHADERTIGSSGFCDVVRAAYEAGDTERLRRLAELDDPDPWLTSDRLARRGEFELALAFARAAPREDTARLVSYLQERKQTGHTAELRADLEAADKLETAGKSADALEILERLLHRGDALEQTLVGTRRGNALIALKRSGEASEAFFEAARNAERIGWLSMAAASYHAAGFAAYEQLDYDNLLAAWGRLRDVERARRRERAAARAQMFLGGVHIELGDYDRGARMVEDARDRFIEMGDDDHTAWALNNLSIAYERRGEYPRAAAVLERSIELALKVGNAYRVACAKVDLGSTLSEMGSSERALKLYHEALALFVDMEDTEGIAQARCNIGIQYVYLGDYEKGVASLEAALGMYAEEEDALLYTSGLNALAWGLMHQGKLARARKLAEQSLESARRIRHSWYEAHALQTLARILLRMEDYKAAERRLTESLRIAAALNSSELQMIAHRDQAKLWIARGNLPRAVFASQRSLEYSLRLLSGFSASEGVMAREHIGPIYEVALRAAAALGKPQALFTAMESARAGAFLEALENREVIRARRVPEELRRRELALRKDARTAVHHFQRAMAGDDLKETRKRRAAMDRARDEVDRVVTQIQRAVREAADLLYPTPSTLAEAQAGLETGDAYVLYSLIGEEALALVVTRQSARMVELGPVAAIEEAAHITLDDPTVDASDPIATLKALLIAPLALEQTTKRLLISPDGILGYVPFALLDGKRTIAFIPSATAYGVLREQRTVRGHAVLALGDPDYLQAKVQPPRIVERGGMHLTPLPASRKEATAIGDVVLVGKNATRRRFFEALGKRDRWHAVHLACHGLVDPEKPTRSALALSIDEDDSNLLSSAEIFNHSIPADLAVLSACNTGKGKIYRTEGIVGLTRSFMLAGSPRVLVSLWKVDDNATQALMIRFYELWNPQAKPGDPELVEGSDRKGLGAAEALKQAQAFVRNHADHPEWKHPYYWAAWVLWGVPD